MFGHTALNKAENKGNIDVANYLTNYKRKEGFVLKWKHLLQRTNISEAVTL